MSTEQFCLRWNDFHTNITSAFSDIRDDDEFLDVTLVCDGDIVRAHKLVLSACSPLFRIMLKKNSHPQPMIFLRGIRFPDMVAILNFMYHGEVNVNQEDLQNFLAAAEELRIKGLSQASSEKLENAVPKMKQVSGGGSGLASQGQPPAKKPRESSPGNSPSSTPVSAKSPAGAEEDEADPPQLSVKREFSLKRSNGGAMDTGHGAAREQQEGGAGGGEGEEEDGQQNNLLDCLVQAQNFALQQAAGNKNFDNNINNFSPQHIMQGSGSGQMTSSQNDKDGVGRGSPVPNPNMKFGGLPYEMHRLGGRNEDGLANVVVMKTFRGWHCPHCSYISPSQKGNLKVHILNRHANPGESFGCMFCGKHLSSRSSLQVHISQVHREEQKAKRMIEERLKITNLEDRLKSEMGGSVMPGDINATAEALRLALQQEERLKLELGNLKSMESLLGGAGPAAGMARMLQMMDQETAAKNFTGLNTGGGGGLESGPASSSGSVPHSPKHGGGGNLVIDSGHSPELSVQQIRRDVELTKVTGSEASLQYQRDIGSVYRKPDTDPEDEDQEEDVVYRKEVGDAVSVYPKDMSAEGMSSYRKELSAGHLEAGMAGAMVYPQSPMYGSHNHAGSGLPQAQGSD